MGFFSWNCKCCGKSIVSPYSPKQINWMNKITMVLETGEVVQGEYITFRTSVISNNYKLNWNFGNYAAAWFNTLQN